MNIPSDLKYTKDHEWLKVEGNVAIVGITDFAQGELGDIVYVEVETEGEELDQEEVFGSIEAVKTVSDLFMPVSGEITEFNDALEQDPETVNNDLESEESKEVINEDIHLNEAAAIATDLVIIRDNTMQDNQQANVY